MISRTNFAKPRLLSKVNIHNILFPCQASTSSAIMTQHTRVPTEIILKILACLQPLDQLAVLLAFPSLAALMTPRHICIDEHGNTTLHILASLGDYVADIAKHLLPRVKDYIDCHDQRGETALMYAAACGHELTVRLLLKKNANVNAWKGYQNTALSYAVETDMKLWCRSFWSSLV